MFSRLFEDILDLLFPRSPLTRELESLDAFMFAARVEKTDGYAGKNIISLFHYRDKLVRQAVWELKYRGNKKIAKLLSEALYDELLAFLEEYAPLTNFTEPLLIPIPLSKKRESERGFNQCRLLCDELMRLDGVSSCISPNKGSTGIVVDCAVSRLRRSFGGQVGRRDVEIKGNNFTLSLALTKTKDTQSQTKAQNRESRMKNLAGCFTADANQILSRNIILIDDVATTGATIEEARRTLRAAGAKKVIAFTVAH
ncbi:MAG: phosphoribosyltransferase family protein [Patescibacteria group bacterium]